jgi:hypothetical protein
MRWRYMPTNVECVGTVCTPNANLPAAERPGMRTELRFQLADVNPEAEAE